MPDIPGTLALAEGDPELIAAIHRARRLLARRALASAAFSAVPVPGIDLAADTALLGRLLPRISAEFGLSVAQIESRGPRYQAQVQKVATAAGAMVVGRLLTRELLLGLAKRAGIRLTARQAAKMVPVAGQLVAAGLGYATLRAMGEWHIRDCVKVARGLRRALPQPDVADALPDRTAPPHLTSGETSPSSTSRPAIAGWLGRWTKRS